MTSPLADYLKALHHELSRLDSGTPADYIPELAKANPAHFGICIVTLDGAVYTVGDADERFTIQSISKPFVYANALSDHGQAYVGRKVGVEPSGDAFNSISLDPRTGAPKNPMINAGAIASTSLVSGETAEAQWTRIGEFIGRFLGRGIDIDEAVYRSESETGFRNRAIAWMLKNFGIVDQDDPMAPLENYFRQCSILVTCRDLAVMAATLANRGVNPVTGTRALAPELVEPVLAVMATCGMYDYAGSWLYEVGMPAKSGVGGGIIAVLPGRFGIGIYSPPLDAKGNSVRGIEVCKRLSRDLGLSIFAHGGTARMALSRSYTGAEAPSRHQYPGAVRERLAGLSHRIRVLGLHGHLGVDGVEYIIRRMLEMVEQTDSFVLDLHQVTAIAAPAARLLEALREQLQQRNIAVVYSRLHDRESLRRALGRGAREAQASRGFLCFEDNDLATEWCEQRLLGDAATQVEAEFAGWSLLAGLRGELVARTAAVTRVETYAAGAQIIAAGSGGDGRVFFIERGYVSILVPLKNGGHQRIESMGPGSSFGEMILLGGKTRSASVHAESEVRCRVLEHADIDRLAERDPELKIALLENLGRDLVVKLKRTTQWVSALA